MLEAISTIAFLAMVVAWAAVEPLRARMARAATRSPQLRTQSAQS